MSLFSKFVFLFVLNKYNIYKENDWENGLCNDACKIHHTFVLYYGVSINNSLFNVLFSLALSGYSRASYRITLALVRPFGHVPHLIRVIFRSFQICYFSTDVFFLLFFQSFCSHAEGTMNKVVDPLHGVPVSYCLFRLPN